MKYNAQLEQIIQLAFDINQTIFSGVSMELYVVRPSVLSSRFKNYDVKKNFQIWLKDGDRTFRPNHLRVMIDLHLRARSRPDLKEQLAQLFDGIFYGEDPGELSKRIDNEAFEHFLNPINITAQLSQLFLIEQEYGYQGESKYNPKTLFYQGWVRQVIDSDKEIDNLIMSIANRQPPAVKFTSLDDKNHKDYSKNPKPLWWLGQ